MSIEDRFAALEGRLRAAEDQLEILNLLNSYGPLVDSGTDQQAAQLWVEGGSYNFTLPDGGTSPQVKPPSDEAQIELS